MSKHMITLDADVREVLEKSIIEGNKLTLPGTPGTPLASKMLARELYVKVNKVLEVAGGKWNRKEKGHIFPEDPRAILNLTLEKGEILDTKKELQQFFTPASLARKIVDEANIEPGMRVLEPSAGDGAIAKVVREQGGKVTCVEIDNKLCDDLISDGFLINRMDFLEYTVEPMGGLFDRIVMNPPFAGGADVAHVTKALTLLAPGGRLVSIMAPGWLTGQHKADKAFRSQMEDLHAEVEEIEEGTFKESGTNVRTIMLVVDMPAADDVITGDMVDKALASFADPVEVLASHVESTETVVQCPQVQTQVANTPVAEDPDDEFRKPFENWLNANNVPFVAINATISAQIGHRLRSAATIDFNDFDFVVYTLAADSKNLLVMVKKGKPISEKCLSDMAGWSKVFGDGFMPVIVQQDGDMPRPIITTLDGTSVTVKFKGEDVVGFTVAAAAPKKPRAQKCKAPQSATPSVPLYLTFHRNTKQHWPNVMQLIKLGDFYEMFGDDARVAAPILETALTTSSHGGETMTGIPYHILEKCIGKLVAAGKCVAVCEPSTPNDLSTLDIVRTEPGLKYQPSQPAPATPEPKPAVIATIFPGPAAPKVRRVANI